MAGIVGFECLCWWWVLLFNAKIGDVVMKVLGDVEVVGFCHFGDTWVVGISSCHYLISDQMLIEWKRYLWHRIRNWFIIFWSLLLDVKRGNHQNQIHSVSVMNFQKGRIAGCWADSTLCWTWLNFSDWIHK